MTMRITMLQARMGEAGAVLAKDSINTVSDAFGASMVGMKYALDTDSVLTPPNSNPARLNSSGGLVDGGGNSVIPRTGTLAWGLSGYLPSATVAVTGAPYAEGVQFVPSAHYNAMRVGVYNADLAAQAGVKVVMASGSTLASGGGLGAAMGLQTAGFPGRPIGAVLGQRTGTWGDATQTTGTLAAAVPTAPAVVVGIGSPEASLNFCDWMANPSVDRVDPITGLEALPVAFVGVIWPAGSKRTYLTMDTTPTSGVAQGATLDNNGDASTAPYGRPVRCVVNSTHDGAVDPAYWVSVGAAREYRQFPAIVVEYQLRDGSIGRQFFNFDDSLSEINEAGVARFTWPREMQRMLSTMAAPIEICNCAISSSTMDMWFNKAKQVLPQVGRGAVISKNWSVNSMNIPMTTVDLANARWHLGRMQSLVDAQKSQVLLVRTTDPVNYSAKAYGSSDALRQNWNAQTVSTKGLNPIDTAAAVSQSAPDVNGQINPIPSFIDLGGVHMPTAGHVAVGTAATTAVRPL